MEATSDGSRGAAQEAVEQETFEAEFRSRVGMSPRRCYLLVLVSLILRTMGSGFVAMAALEYTRYYVINDLNIIATLETATGTVQCLAKAVMYPFLGVIADQVSRKRIILAASIAATGSIWLFAFVPSVVVLVLMRILSIMGDLGYTITNAMLRDLFSDAEWERKDGGVTGIKSRMVVVATVASAFMVAIGMVTMKLGESGFFGSYLLNEYSEKKELCHGRRHCVPVGQFSWREGTWELDGSLRLLVLMGACFYTLEMLVICFLLPETLKQPNRGTKETFSSYVRRNWRQMGTPWNNLRVFATPQLRNLLYIRIMYYIIAGGRTALFTTWYRRNEEVLDTFTMHMIGVPSGAMGFLVLFCVPCLTRRYGDLRGIWVPAGVLAIAMGFIIALLPAEQWQLSFVLFPLIGGTGTALAFFTPELLTKLVPADVQGTFHTARTGVHDVNRAVLAWPWLGLLAVSEGFPYPLDSLCVWIALVIGFIALGLTFRELRRDPKDAIVQGTALHSFWETAYAKGEWYRRHSGREVPLAWDAKGSDLQVEDAKVVGGPSQLAIVPFSPGGGNYCQSPAKPQPVSLGCIRGHVHHGLTMTSMLPVWTRSTILGGGRRVAPEQPHSVADSDVDVSAVTAQETLTVGEDAFSEVRSAADVSSTRM